MLDSKESSTEYPHRVGPLSAGFPEKGLATADQRKMLRSFYQRDSSFDVSLRCERSELESFLQRDMKQEKLQ